jgi:hypothetical protein
MVMTNGERIRKRPELLERMMKKAGLTEICFHVDTTMKGRTGHYAATTTEEELNGLRAEFADIIRRARLKTGLKLEAASTVTVTQSNLEAIPAVVQWFLTNADVFKMVAFLPAASIGCTDSALQGVTSEVLWSRIEKGAGDPQLMEGEGWLGHPSCGRFVQGLSVRRKHGHTLVPLYLRTKKSDMRFLNKLLDRIGGTSFRLDSRKKATSRTAYILKGNLLFFLVHGIPYLWRLVRRTQSFHAHYFSIVSHHFMSASELSSPLGIERNLVCAFKVPVNGELISMCSFNATGMRDMMREPTDSRVPAGQKDS